MSKNFSVHRLLAIGLITVCASVVGFSLAFSYFALFALSAVRIFSLIRSRGSVFLTVHYTVLSIYFSSAPAFQQLAEISFWGFGQVRHDYGVSAFWALCAYCIGVELGHREHRSMRFSVGAEFSSKTVGIVALAVATLSFLALFIRPDLNFIPRGLAFDRNSRAVELIFYSTLPKSLLLACLAAACLNALRAKAFLLRWVVPLMILVLSMAGASPVTTARQILLIGLFPLVLFFTINRSRGWIVLSLWLSVAGVGPVLNFFSRNVFYEVETTYFPFSADFDAMYVSAAFLQVGSGYDLGLGRYMVNAWSFLLPKDWKPFSSFDPLQTDSAFNAFSQANLSFPPFMTAYLDGGLLASLALGLLVGLLFAKILASGLTSLASPHAAMMVFVSLSAYVPFLRGPILGWGSFAFSAIIALVILRVVTNFVNKLRAG